KKLLKAIETLKASRDDSSKVVPAPDGNDMGERRQVAVLFVDLVGYTALSRTLDPEEVHNLLDEFFSIVDSIIQTQGGRIDKHIGDCVMGVFGAPVSHNNDAERALHAALAIQDRIPGFAAALGHTIGVHMGIAAGQVVARTTGSAAHREYTVTGDSVNLAS